MITDEERKHINNLRKLGDLAGVLEWYADHNLPDTPQLESAVNWLAEFEGNPDEPYAEDVVRLMLATVSAHRLLCQRIFDHDFRRITDGDS